MMLLTLTAAERPDLAERAAELGEQVWPEYNRHGDILNRYWGRLTTERPEFQFVLYDEAEDEVVAEGHSVPLRWDGTVSGLPAGIDGAIQAAFEPGDEPTTLCAMAAEIRPRWQGRGLSRLLLEAMAALAARHGLPDLVAPVRPSWKERYPLTAIADYAGWTRADGLPFDPWLRVHARIGGETLATDPHSLRISGTVSDWEAWTGQPFPQTGEYVFPRGLALVAIDRERDEGLYFEPNVWMRHRVTASP